jgi:integrase
MNTAIEIPSKLYKSHILPGYSAMPFEDVPYFDMELLTADNTFAEACYAYCHGDIKERVKNGSARAHEPYNTLASKFKEVTIREACSRRFATLYRQRMITEGLSGQTINGIISKFRKVCQMLENLEVIEFNPWDKVASVKSDVAPKRRNVRFMTQDEIDHVLHYLNRIMPYAKVKRGMYADICELALETAMRYGEVLQLRKMDYDPVAGVIYIQEHLAKTRTGRQVALSPKAREILNDHLPAGEGDRFFPITYQNISRHLAKYNKTTGRNVFFHLFRHTAISRYVYVAESLQELLAFSGHATIRGVLPYLHGDQARNVKMVNARLAAQAAEYLESDTDDKE